MSKLKKRLAMLTFFLTALIIGLIPICYSNHYDIQILGESMEPNLSDKEKVVVKRKKELERFDIVVLASPILKETNIVKRVIGLPGDELMYKKNQLYIDGKAMEESFITKKEINQNRNFTLDSLNCTNEQARVPRNMVFIIGDNRGDSMDSREFGFVPIASIKGYIEKDKQPFLKAGRSKAVLLVIATLLAGTIITWMRIP